MGTHRDWWKPIFFTTNKYHLYDYKRWAVASYVTYGMGNWINRCVWIVPGTISVED